MSDFDKQLLKRIVEGVLLASQAPLTVSQIADVFIDPDMHEAGPVPDAEEIQATLEDIQSDCRGHGYELKEVASGWRYQVPEELARWIGRLWEEKPVRYSRATLETLALVAYRQPITRGDIEDIRGVAVSSGIIKTLLERQWIRIVGHRDVPGRPALYATTRQFLDYFNLKSLDELPALAEIRDIDKLNAELDFEQEQQMAAALGVAAVNAGLETSTDDNLAADGAANSATSSAADNATVH